MPSDIDRLRLIEAQLMKIEGLLALVSIEVEQIRRELFGVLPTLKETK